MKEEGGIMGRGAALQRPKAERAQVFGELEFLRNRWFSVVATAAAPPCAPHFVSRFSECRPICASVGLGSPSQGDAEAG